MESVLPASGALKTAALSCSRRGRRGRSRAPADAGPAVLSGPQPPPHSLPADPCVLCAGDTSFTRLPHPEHLLEDAVATLCVRK
ncbi:hypothetical protein NN561_003046 [Cricetulus griseus]